MDNPNLSKINSQNGDSKKGRKGRKVQKDFCNCRSRHLNFERCSTEAKVLFSEDVVLTMGTKYFHLTHPPMAAVENFC